MLPPSLSLIYLCCNHLAFVQTPYRCLTTLPLVSPPPPVPLAHSALKALTGAITGAMSDAVQGLGAETRASGGEAGAPTDPAKLTMKKIKIQKKEVMIYHCGR